MTTLSTATFNERVVEASPATIPVSIVLFDDDISGYDLGPVSASAIRLTANSDGKYAAFVYEPTIGGKVGFVGHLGIGTTEADFSARELLLTEVRWVLGT